MGNIVPLNNVIHKDLKIVRQHSEKYSRHVNAVIAFPFEFADIQREYPILFQKDSKSQQYQAIALLGIAAAENLFIENGQWNARYIPAIVARDPFAIGFEDQTLYGGEEHTPIVMIDMDSPRITENEGQSVFLEFGGNTPYLENISHILQNMYQSTTMANAMFALFSEMDLIEPIALEIKLHNGELHRLSGNYTINREKLESLPAEQIFKLHQAGFLECAYFVINSLDNIKHLIEIKNTQI